MPGCLGFLGLLDQVRILRRFVTPIGIHPVNDTLDIVGGLFLAACSLLAGCETTEAQPATQPSRDMAQHMRDMAKSVDKSIVIGPVRLERKSGGKSGVYDRSQPDAK